MNSIMQNVRECEKKVIMESIPADIFDKLDKRYKIKNQFDKVHKIEGKHVYGDLWKIELERGTEDSIMVEKYLLASPFNSGFSTGADIRYKLNSKKYKICEVHQDLIGNAVFEKLSHKGGVKMSIEVGKRHHAFINESLTIQNLDVCEGLGDNPIYSKEKVQLKNAGFDPADDRWVIVTKMRVPERYAELKFLGTRAIRGKDGSLSYPMPE